jgi:hypothetical protein
MIVAYSPAQMNWEKSLCGIKGQRRRQETRGHLDHEELRVPRGRPTDGKVTASRAESAGTRRPGVPITLSDFGCLRPVRAIPPFGSVGRDSALLAMAAQNGVICGYAHGLNDSD